MSYKKAMKWLKKHPKGTKQPVIMHTNSGFWPSKSFSDKWVAYVTQCEAEGRPHLSIEDYYKSQLHGNII